MTETQWVTLVIAILGVLHGPLTQAFLRKPRKTRESK